MIERLITHVFGEAVSLLKLYRQHPVSAMIAFRDRYTRAWLCTGACTGTIQRVTPQILIELHQQHCSDYSAGRYRHCYDCLLRYAERASLRELYGPRHDGCPSAPCAPAFRMPAPCLREHQTFQDFCRVRGCTPIGATSLFSILHRFLLSFANLQEYTSTMT